MRKKKYNRAVGLLLSEETYKELVKITDQKEISLSELIRDLVEQELRKINEEEKSNE